jgi:hypothetical protein
VTDSARFRLSCGISAVSLASADESSAVGDRQKPFPSNSWFGRGGHRGVEMSRSELLVEVASRVGRRFRLRLRGEPEPADWEWCPWLIAPVAGYLETGPVGPYPWRAVAWVEVEPSVPELGAVMAAFAAVGLTAEVVGGTIRVSCPGSTPDAEPDDAANPTS